MSLGSMKGPGTGQYRTRKGIFGKAVLQQLYDFPMFIGGHVDASMREFIWLDIHYKHAPAQLLEANQQERGSDER